MVILIFQNSAILSHYELFNVPCYHFADLKNKLNGNLSWPSPTRSLKIIRNNVVLTFNYFKFLEHRIYETAMLAYINLPEGNSPGMVILPTSSDFSQVV